MRLKQETFAEAGFERDRKTTFDGKQAIDALRRTKRSLGDGGRRRDLLRV